MVAGLKAPIGIAFKISFLSSIGVFGFWAVFLSIKPLCFFMVHIVYGGGVIGFLKIVDSTTSWCVLSSNLQLFEEEHFFLPFGTIFIVEYIKK